MPSKEFDKNVLSALTPKEKKKKINPQHKGKSWESDAAAILTKISGLHFQRIFSSGASVGQSNRHRIEELTIGQTEQMLGDIAAPETMKQHLIFECKNYADLDIHNLISTEQGSKTFYGWLGEMMYDVESALTTLKSSRVPIGFLCVKLTRKGSWITVNIGAFRQAFGTTAVFNPPYVMLEHEPRPGLVEAKWSQRWVMIDFERFIKDNADFMFQQMNDAEIAAMVKATVERNVAAIQKRSLKDELKGKVSYLEGKL